MEIIFFFIFLEVIHFFLSYIALKITNKINICCFFFETDAVETLILFVDLTLIDCLKQKSFKKL